MIELITRAVAVLLLVGALLHAWGSLVAFKPKTPERAWSLGAAGLAVLLSVLGWVVAAREDAILAFIVAGGCVFWAGTVVAFGRAIGNVADPRVLYHLAAGTALAVLVLV
jgi:hypothetical protein